MTEASSLWRAKSDSPGRRSRSASHSSWGSRRCSTLTHWRMQLAANHLLISTDNITTIAELTGYESEAAFSRAFKKIVGTPPSEWRKQHRFVT
jgi:AraC-like DNA-binding protein